MRYFEHAPFYLLRMPAKSVSEAFKFFSIERNDDSEVKKKYFIKLFSNNHYKESIRLVSEDLYQQLLCFLDDNLSVEKEEAIIATLYKYLVRMATRCTPFGLFAGWNTGEIKDMETDISFTPGQYIKHERLCMSSFTEWLKIIIKDPKIKNQLKFRLNDTLYACGNDYRYIEYVDGATTRVFNIASVPITGVLQEIVEKVASERGLEYIKEIILPFANSEEEVDNYIEKLIASQLLVSELEPNITGLNYDEFLISSLKKLRYTEHYVKDLESFSSSVKQIPQISEANLTSLKHKYQLNDGKTIKDLDMQIHLQKNNLNSKNVTRILAQFEEYIDLGGFMNVAVPEIERFKAKFLERYDNQLIPLLSALDAETGIGYGANDAFSTLPTPLLSNLSTSAVENETQSIKWNTRNQFLYNLIMFNKGQKAISLTEEDLLPFKQKETIMNFPKTMNLMGNWVEETEDRDLNRSKFAITTMGGVTAGSLLNRFCYADKRLEQYVSQLIKEEEESYKPAILAEIVHLPDARVGNIVRGPSFRTYEIPVLTRSGVVEENQILLKDLWVCVRNNKIKLISKNLGKEVIPRLTNAYNYSRGSVIYKFLADIQYQGTSGFRQWDWSVFSKEPFLPRIEFKNLILCPAQWYLKKDKFKSKISNKKNINEQYLTLLSNFATKWQLPDNVLMVNGDNELLLNLKSSTSLKILSHELHKKDVRLKEFMFENENTWLKDKLGNAYTNEVIIPLLTKCKYNQSEHFSAPTIGDKVRRRFIPGSEWLYFKIYVGPKVADRIITEVIKPLAETLTAESVIEKWFFIRYNDPDNHIRVRFSHGTKKDFWKIVQERFYERIEPFVEKGLVYKITTDTYTRELERYGSKTMVISEDMFHADSLAIAGFLDLIVGEEGERYRWLFALRNIDMLLDDFAYDDEMKSALLGELYTDFYQEINKDAKSKKLMISLNDKYRQNARLIEKILDKNLDTDEISEAVACFEQRAIKNSTLVAEIKAKVSPVVYRQTIRSLLPSYIHMTMNRTFLIRQRIHEMVVYHHLSKYYLSRLARKMSNVKEQPVACA